jgi:hypothetical protein
VSMVRRFWIEFDRNRGSVLWWGPPYAGVTGFDEKDCLAMVADLLPADAELPPVLRITADVSLAGKLPGNPWALGVSVWRGVWYPPMNLRTGPNMYPHGHSLAVNPSYRPTAAGENVHTGDS